MRRLAGRGGWKRKRGARPQAAWSVWLALLVGCSPAMPPEDATPRGRFEPPSPATADETDPEASAATTDPPDDDDGSAT